MFNRKRRRRCQNQAQNTSAKGRVWTTRVAQCFLERHSVVHRLSCFWRVIWSIHSSPFTDILLSVFPSVVHYSSCYISPHKPPSMSFLLPSFIIQLAIPYSYVFLTSCFSSFLLISIHVCNRFSQALFLHFHWIRRIFHSFCYALPLNSRHFTSILFLPRLPSPSTSTIPHCLFSRAIISWKYFHVSGKNALQA